MDGSAVDGHIQSDERRQERLLGMGWEAMNERWKKSK